MPYVMDPTLGPVQVDDATASQLNAQYGWAVVGGSNDGGNVAPETVGLYQMLNYLLQAQDRVNAQQQTGISQFNADTQRMGTQAQDATAFWNAWRQATGPQDWARLSDLGVGGSGNVLDFAAALNGQMGEGGLDYGPIGTHDQMKNAENTKSSGIKDLFAGGGGGGGGSTGGATVMVNGQQVAGPGAQAALPNGGVDASAAFDAPAAPAGGWGAGSHGPSRASLGAPNARSRDLEGVGYQRTGPNAIGDPRRYQETLGMDVYDQNGQFINPTWDAAGRPVLPDSWAGKYFPRMPTNGLEQQQYEAWVRSGFQGKPAYDGAGSQSQDQSQQQGDTSTSAGSAPTDRTTHDYYAPGAVQGESALEKQYREAYGSKASLRAAAESGRGIQGSYDGPGWGADSTTIVIAADGSRREYRDRDGAVITRGSQSAQPQVEMGQGPPLAPTAAGAPGQPPVARFVGSTETMQAKGPTEPTAPTRPGSAPASNREAGNSGGSYSASGRSLSEGQDKSTQEKAADRARRQEEARATGGIDVVKKPTHILAGEGGKPELHIIVPMDNPNVEIPQWIKDVATAVEPGKADTAMKPLQFAEGGAVAAMPSAMPPDMPTPGDVPDPMAAASAPGMGGPPMPHLVCTPNPDGTYRLIDPQSGQVIAEHATMAQLQPLMSAGIVTMAGDQGPQGMQPGMPGAGMPGASVSNPLPMKKGGVVVTPPAVPTTPPLPSGGVMGANPRIWSANRPTNLSSLGLDYQTHYNAHNPKLIKNYDSTVQPSWTNRQGMTQVLTKPGHWSNTQAWKNLPVVQPQEAQASTVASMGPVERGLWSSALGNMGETWDDWLFKFTRALPPNVAPNVVRTAGRF